MIEIPHGDVLERLMEHRYEPVLVQVLRMIVHRTGARLLNANPCDTCKPVREVWLYPDFWQGGQMSRIMHQVNAAWQYNDLPDEVVMLFESDFSGQRVRVRVTDETRRRV